MSAKNEENDYRKGLDPQSLKQSFAHHLKYTLGRDRYTATDLNRYSALALAIRDRLVERWFESQQTYHNLNCKRVYYLSVEFMMGRALSNNIINMNLETPCEDALRELGLDWHELAEMETDAGLGNGGLGRLAACFLDSMATLSLPSVGYGLRYDYGIFNQLIRNGYQVEEPDEWLRHGYPWEICRPEYSYNVHFRGRVEKYVYNGREYSRLVDTRPVVGLPYDTPIIGYGSNNVNTLRLWSAKAAQEFDLEDFNRGDYVDAVDSKNRAEILTKVLYPNDNVSQGKELRFKQQYFFVSCSIQDILRRYKNHNPDVKDFPNKVAIQINDTHPSLGILELMHLFLDEHHLEWEQAWELTVNAMAYTNHTLLPEALEKWPVAFFEKYLPRHLEILYEINRRFLRKVFNKYPGDNERARRLSLVEETDTKQVRMAHLATVGSHSVNGVAQLHTDLLKSKVLKDFYEFFPERFNNKTNGVTPRRWMLLCNPKMSSLITDTIGPEWITDLHHLKKLEPHAEKKDFRAKFRAVKRENKIKLAEIIQKRYGIKISPDSIYDAHIKRIHEYKRQLLNALHIIMLYNRLKDNPNLDMNPRTFIFAGKSAPGYYMAKLIIKLVHCLGDVINGDEGLKDKLKVVFMPNYSVSLAQEIIPAADVSEQISTAGMEASGTGCMKLSMNGALTIGTLDGANIEIKEEVGDENIFICGNTVEQLAALRDSGYDPNAIYQKDAEIKRALDLLFSNFFNPDERGLFEPIRAALLYDGDHFMHLADLRDYADAQARLDRLYSDPEEWSKKAILNVARTGKFSSDRTIAEYNNEIWKAPTININMREKRCDTLLLARKNVTLE